ncbi:32593_t:CDS:1, partial [Racocetra persica]
HFNPNSNSSDEEPDCNSEELHSTRLNSYSCDHNHGCSCGHSRGHPKLSNTTSNNQQNYTIQQSKSKCGRS